MTATSRSPFRAGRGSPLTWRIFVAVGSVVAATLAATLVLISVVAQRTADVAIDRALDRTAHLASVLLDARQHALTRAASVLIQNPDFRTTVVSGTPEDVFDRALEASQRLEATWVQLIDSTGLRLARSDDPTAPRVSLLASALIAGALSGEAVAGFGSSADTLLFQTIAVPITQSVGDAFAPAAPVSGALMAAQDIDSSLVAEVVQATASDIVFFAVDTAGTPHVTASSLGRAPPLPELVHAHLRETGGDSSGTRRIALALRGVDYVGRLAPLHSAGGEVLGGFVALRAHDLETAPFAALRRWIVAAGVAALALAFALSYLTARSIARPVLALADATRRVADGDYSAPPEVQTGDEIGALAESVRTMLIELREKEALVALLRDPARTGSLTPRSAAVVQEEAVGAGIFTPGRVVLNRFEISGVLGSGGAGIVYKALDRELGEVVALKTMRPDAIDGEPNALERFRSEIRLARRISHRNVVRTYDIGEAGGVHFISMEYVTGTSLRDLIDREGRLPVPATFSIARQLCRALEVAHEEGIVHRDIKPQNLLLQPDGTLKVMDFGIARHVRRNTALTEVGMVVGTPDYMAPEQLMGEAVDGRADLYATGVVLYECLTGTLPFAADSPLAMIGLKLNAVVVPPHERATGIPVRLSELVSRLLARDPSARPSSAAATHDFVVEAER